MKWILKLLIKIFLNFSKN